MAAIPTNAPITGRRWGRGTLRESCAACGQPVFANERLSAEGLGVYHRACFSCEVCQGRLTLSNYVSLEGHVFCKPHYKERFAFNPAIVNHFPVAEAEVPLPSPASLATLSDMLGLLSPRTPLSGEGDVGFPDVASLGSPGVASTASIKSADLPDMGDNALHIAVKSDDLLVAGEVLRDRPELLNSVDSWGRTAVMVAASAGSVDVLTYLLSQGADPTIRSRHGGTPVAVSSSQHHKSLVADANPLGFASSNGHFEAARILLSSPALRKAYSEPGFSQDVLGDTVLHSCTRSCSTQLVTMLLACGIVNPDLQNNEGQTALDVAADFDVRTAFVFSIETYGSPSGAPDSTARPLHVVLTSSLGTTEMQHAVRQELERGADPDLPGEDGDPPLVVVARNGDATLLAIMLSFGAAPAVKDSNGRTALAHAMALGDVECVKVLLAHPDTCKAYSGDALGADAHGNTLMHDCARSANPTLFAFIRAFSPWNTEEALLSKNNDGHTPYDVLGSDDEKTIWKMIMGGSGRVLPLPVSVPSAVPCSVCMLPPPSSAEGMAYTCVHCASPYCSECFVHLGQSSINAGAYPLCSTLECKQDIPVTAYAASLPMSQRLILVAMLVNREQTTDAVFRRTCPACDRVNDLEPVYANTAPDANTLFSCNHCDVRLCAVCNYVFPKAEADKSLHEACLVKFPVVGRFVEFQEMVVQKGQRFCPECHTAGLKDDACTHMSCSTPSCGKRWCYICGLPETETGVGLGTHGSDWQSDSTRCPMYAKALQGVDQRIRDAGCGASTCDENSPCADDTCRIRKDRFANNILATLRVRFHILEFAKKMGKARFAAMLQQFNWQGMINANFFEGRFDFTTPELQTFDAFLAPDIVDTDIGTFYKDRLRWFDDKFESLGHYTEPPQYYCFDGEGQVRMADGSTRLLKTLKKGDKVATDCGSASIVRVFTSEVKSTYWMVDAGGFRLTPGHPVFLRGQWYRPDELPCQSD